MDAVRIHIANFGIDMLTNPTLVQLHIRMHGFTTIHITNPGGDMLTNPTVVQLHVRMHECCDSSHCKP